MISGDVASVRPWAGCWTAIQQQDEMKQSKWLLYSPSSSCPVLRSRVEFLFKATMLPFLIMRRFEVNSVVEVREAQAHAPNREFCFQRSTFQVCEHNGEL
jgi:hypothetical protein